MKQDRFQSVISRIKGLKKDPRYLAAFLFGSAARNELNDYSDIDVNVIVKGRGCNTINHPVINGIKLDLTFLSYDQLVKRTRKEMGEDRPAIIADSKILFDKTGKVTKLKKLASRVKPPRCSPSSYNIKQFMVYHANDKVRRNLSRDPDSALLSMGIGINDLIKIFYHLNGKWTVSNKMILGDLDGWNRDFANLIRKFLREGDIRKKYVTWKLIMEYVTKPMGGILDISKNVCGCKNCRNDIAALNQ